MATCLDCGVTISWRAKRCRLHYKQAVERVPICACGKPKLRRSDICGACADRARPPDEPGIMRNFDPEQFRRLRAKAGLSVEQLCDATGVPVKTVRNWEQAVSKPLKATFSRIMLALGLRACPACKGSGMVSSEADRIRVLKAVNSPPKKPHHWTAAKARAYRERKKQQMRSA